MAMSLEDLLSKEGFKRRKARLNPRTSSSGPLYMQENKHESASLMAVKRTERTRSDIPQYHSKGDFSTSGSFTGRKPRDTLSSKGKPNAHRDSLDANKILVSIGSSNDCEIVEVGMNRSYKDVYSNKVYSHSGNGGTRSGRNEVHKNNGDMNHKNSSFKETNFGESRSINLDNNLQEVVDAPALDEVAVKAVISILSSYAKRFVEDEDFRTSVHQNSFACLNLIGLYEGLNTESCKVVENLEQAIEIVEKVVEERANLQELKKASLQLSVITGLNSNDLKDGFTSGIPNARLSACSHLYLGVIYVLQKKDRIAAKHLLQVFCDSPSEARTTLLPDLWDRVFLPHLLHLKVWYDKETRYAADSPVVANLKLLDKVYNESLDSGTYLFAMYYKDWITDGVEAPSVPLIGIPSFSVHAMPRGVLLGHTSSPASHISPQPMVSKVLYNEVFRHSHKAAVRLDENSNSPAPQDKQLILYTHDSATQNHKTISESPSDNIHILEDKVLSELKQSEDSVNDAAPRILPHPDTVALKTGTEPLVQEAEEKFEFSIPQDFVCPLTGLLFKDPVTLETGQTFDNEAITDWFCKGGISCPVSRRELQCQTVPPTNLILKRVIDKWKADHIELLFALLPEKMGRNGSKFIFILGQLLPLFSEDERVVNAKRVLSLGGLQLLIKRFPSADSQEKTFILSLLCCCIEADAGCRNDIARDINVSNLLQLLLHNEGEIKLRSNAVSLLIELVCFNRRSRAKSFLEGLLDEEIIKALDHLIMFLHTCPSEQAPLVAVLILHLDLLSERENNNVYKEEAVDALTVALRRSLSDEKVQNKCCRALLILGGFFSSSGKLMTEDWILKLAGFLNGPEPHGDCADDDESNDVAAYGTMTTVDLVNEEEEVTAREKWLVRISPSLVGDRKKSFVDAVSMCLNSGNSDMVRVCLTTVAWLSFSLASLHDTESQLCAMSALVSPLKQCLEYGELVEHKILASLSLLNFTTIPECRILLMKIGEEVGPCLDKLSEVTWTARELHAILSG